MANTVSSEKRNRQSIKRAARNQSVKTEVKSAIKKAREVIAGGDPVKIKAALSSAAALLDRAATKGVLHTRNASRRIARLSLAAGKTGKPAAAPAAK